MWLAGAEFPGDPPISIEQLSLIVSVPQRAQHNHRSQTGCVSVIEKATLGERAYLK